MEAQTAAVTPLGVARGEPAALRALVARRGPAVLGYCREVCDPEVAPRAAAEAFARFRAAVHDAAEPNAIDPELFLLGATRHAAASMARTAQGGGRRLLRVGRGSTEACSQVPTLLAARAAGSLGPADSDRLERHLQRCAGCRAVEQAFRRAERAYRDPPPGDMGPVESAIVLAALASAAPMADGAGAQLAAALAVQPPAEPAKAGTEPDEDEDEDDTQAAHADDLVEPGDEEEDDEGAGDEDDEDAQPTALVPSPAVVPAAEETADAQREPGADQPTGAAGALAALRRGAPGARVPDLRIVLPVGVLLAAIVVTMAVAGVFGGDEATPPAARETAAQRALDEPVTTPLPVTVPVPEPEIPGETQTQPEPGTQTTPTAPQGTAPPATDPGPRGDAGESTGTGADGAQRELDADGSAGGGGGAGGQAPVFEPGGAPDEQP